MTTLLERRFRTLGPHSPLFYDEPVEIVRGEGVWLTAADGTRYLDAYNNVPHVGHAHPRVVEAVRAQAATLNLHTRYLNERVVGYAEQLLATFEDSLSRVELTNSGSESNDLAFRIAAQHTGSTGVLVSDFSYHGNTALLARITTGLAAHEGLGENVRAFRVPDLDASGAEEAALLSSALADVDRAIAELQASGHGVSAVILESIFSTEGLARVPAGYVTGLAERVRAAGGLVIADEVQSGFGRTGDHFWGHQAHGLLPDLVTLGKPAGNGHPIGGVVTTAELHDEFGARNMYFNTFAGNPVSAAAGQAVLDVLRDEDLVARSSRLGGVARERLAALAAGFDRIGPVKGSGLFFGFEIFADAAGTRPDAAATKAVVEGVKSRGVLLSRIGRDDSVLKIRPPLAIAEDEIEVLVRAVEQAVDAELGAR